MSFPGSRAARSVLVVLAASAAAAAPLSAQMDACLGAFSPMIGPGIYPSSLVGFTVPFAVAPCDGTASPGDGWWLYTALSTGFATISMCPSDGGSTGTFAPGQAVLAAYDATTATACPSPFVVGCSTGDPCCGGAPRIVFPIQPGMRFMVQIDYAGAGPAVGADTCTLAVIESAAPPPMNNDECLCAQPVIDGCNGPFNNFAATTSAPTGSCGFMGNDLWYVWTAGGTTGSGSGCTAFITTCSSALDTVISVWNGCPSGGGFEIACNDDSPKLTWPGCWGTSQSFVELPVVIGQTYWIAVGGAFGQTGTFQLNIHTHFTMLIEESAPGFIQARYRNGCPFDTALGVFHLEFGTPPYFIGGECPHIGNGPFFGINPSIAEIFFAFSNYGSLTPPFFAALDGCGDATVGPYAWPGPLPYIDAVGFSVTGFSTICNISPPIRYL